MKAHDFAIIIESMKYAVVQTGGKQYKVSEGSVIEVDKLDVESGTSFVFDKVLLSADGDNVQIGQPLVAGATVTAQVLEQKRGEKIRVAKFKAKARYRRVMGFRAELTKLQVSKIDAK
jgi:large subunit ribosomal protein L21